MFRFALEGKRPLADQKAALFPPVNLQKSKG